MKKLVVLSAVLLALVACGDPGGGTSNPPIQAFTATGTANIAPNQDINLTDSVYVNGVKVSETFNIGTFKTDKTVNITLSEDYVRNILAYITEPWSKTFSSEGCDSKPTLSGDGKVLQFHKTDNFNYKGQSVYLIPGTFTQPSDTVQNVQFKEFWYSTAAIHLSGTGTCNGASYFFNVDLKPGWNIVDYNHTAIMIGDTYEVRNYSFPSAVSATTYNGPWIYFLADPAGSVGDNFSWRPSQTTKSISRP